MDVLGKACKDKEESCGDGKLNFAEISDILTIANQVAEHSRQGIYECVEFPHRSCTYEFFVFPSYNINIDIDCFTQMMKCIGSCLWFLKLK